MSLAYVILWPTTLSDTYQYGGKVTMTDTLVTYSAPLMPPGETIHRWHCTTDFRWAHHAPDLPVLTAGEKYHLVGDIDVEDGAVYLRVIFTDDTGLQLKPAIIDGVVGDFTMPEEAVDYQIELVNTHHRVVRFHSLLLTTADDFDRFTFTLNPALGTLVATPKEGSPQPTLYVTVRQEATKPIAIAQTGTLGVYLTPKQRDDATWLLYLRQELGATLINTGAASGNGPFAQRAIAGLTAQDNKED